MRLGDQHPEKSMLLHEIPDRLGDLLLGEPDLPVVDHPTELVCRAVEKGALLGRKLDTRHGAQLLPVGPPGEQLRIEADRAGLEGLRLGIRNLGQDTPDGGKGRSRDQGAPQRDDGRQRQDDRWQKAEPPEPGRCRDIEAPVHQPGLPYDRHHGQENGPGPRRGLPHRQGKDCHDAEDGENELDQDRSLPGSASTHTAHSALAPKRTIHRTVHRRMSEPRTLIHAARKSGITYSLTGLVVEASRCDICLHFESVI